MKSYFKLTILNICSPIFKEIFPLQNNVDEEKIPPFIEVPISVTEDRLLGSVDIKHLTENRVWKIQQGLLEIAHQGALYIDEVLSLIHI